MRLCLFPTCVVDAVEPAVGVAATRLLRRLGHEVSIAEDATCCGQPAWNAGQAEASARVAKTTLNALSASGAELIVVPAGSCTTMIRVFWPELFEVVGDHRAAESARAVAGRVRELSEFLDGQSVPPATRPSAGAVVYHRSCHMMRELGITDQPERLLDRVATHRVETAACGRCCGFGGLFSVKLPETSVAMGDDVLGAAVAAGAEEVVGCDSSCLLHLAGRAARTHPGLRFRHLAEVLEDATR